MGTYNNHVKIYIPRQITNCREFYKEKERFSYGKMQLVL